MGLGGRVASIVYKIKEGSRQDRVRHSVQLDRVSFQTLFKKGLFSNFPHSLVNRRNSARCIPISFRSMANAV